MYITSCVSFAHPHHNLRPKPHHDPCHNSHHTQHGNKWAKLASLLPGRTENAVKSRCKALLRGTAIVSPKRHSELLQVGAVNTGSIVDTGSVVPGFGAAAGPDGALKANGPSLMLRSPVVGIGVSTGLSVPRVPVGLGLSTGLPTVPGLPSVGMLDSLSNIGSVGLDAPVMAGLGGNVASSLQPQINPLALPTDISLQVPTPPTLTAPQYNLVHPPPPPQPQTQPQPHFATATSTGNAQQDQQHLHQAVSEDGGLSTMAANAIGMDDGEVDSAGLGGVGMGVGVDDSGIDFYTGHDPTLQASQQSQLAAQIVQEHREQVELHAQVGHGMRHVAVDHPTDHTSDHDLLSTGDTVSASEEAAAAAMAAAAMASVGDGDICTDAEHDDEEVSAADAAEVMAAAAMAASEEEDDDEHGAVPMPMGTHAHPQPDAHAHAHAHAHQSMHAHHSAPPVPVPAGPFEAHRSAADL
mmetsp:Transcript_10075/g.26284  ORF Transcript_10075/g.26284 Transcript_10075/m.26284 type:complete len:467 (-) Transcript_10075:1140-2540(-)